MHKYTILMTPTHDEAYYAEDAGPWEFPFEVEITKNKTVVYTPE